MKASHQVDYLYIPSASEMLKLTIEGSGNALSNLIFTSEQNTDG